MNISLGITTAPREKSTLGECLASVIASGFDAPYIFSDSGYKPKLEQGGICLHRPDTIAEPRFNVAGNRLGAWRNWVQSLADLVAAEPTADAVLLIQDDVRFSRGVAEFLADGHWALPDIGLVTLHTSEVYKGVARRRGLNRLDAAQTVICGACTILMTREVAERVLAHPLSQEATGWHLQWGSAEHAKKIDMYIGSLMVRMGLHQYGYRPSLAEHFATTSTLGNGVHSVHKSLQFAGLNADASEEMNRKAGLVGEHNG